MSTRRFNTMCLVVACLGALLACEKAAPPSPPTTSPPAAAPAKPTPAAVETPVATAPPLKLEAVPAREDFEEEAETQITAGNLEKQLEALEKEISSD